MNALETLLRIPRIDNEYDFEISPDGNMLLFSSNLTGRWELYKLQPFHDVYTKEKAVDLAGLTALTSGDGAKFAPCLSPDGRHAAYAVDLDGSENYHLFMLDLQTGRTSDLTPVTNFSIQPGFAWSPDGREIVLSADLEKCFDVYLLEAKPGAEFRKVFGNNHPCWPPKWSPNGEWLAIEVEWQASKLSIFLKNLRTTETRQLGSGLSAKDPCWSPDGGSLAFCSDENGFYQIGIYDVSKNSIHWRTNESANFENPVYDSSGENIIATRQLGTNTRLELFTRDGRRPLTIGPGMHSHARFTPDGKAVLCIYENLRRPPELWQINLTTGSSRQIVKSLPDDMQTNGFPKLEEVTYPGTDGVPIPALLYSAEHKHAPCIVLVHGGPNWYYSDFWHSFIAYCGSRGWTVLAPNYRGSTGYGRGWEERARFDYGGVDTRDVAAGAQWLIQKGIADPTRIAVTGASHGGYLTMTCLTQYPELWAAGSAVVPFLNWFTAHDSAREDLQFWDIENMGDPLKNEALWRERSPFFFLDRIQAPVQLICGANDPRCPASESLAARDRLVELGKDVDLIMYENEGHGFLKLETTLDAEKRRIEFLARILDA